MTFEENIKSWVALDNKIKTYNEALKNLRDERNNLENEIVTYADDSLPDNAVIKITDGTLRFANTKQQQPLTYKYVNECLNEVINNPKTVEQIMNHIKNNRSEKINRGIKRVYEN